MPGGTSWNVDSFFDITYRIDFVGAPGGPLARHVGQHDRHDPDAGRQPETPLPTVRATRTTARAP